MKYSKFKGRFVSVTAVLILLFSFGMAHADSVVKKGKKWKVKLNAMHAHDDNVVATLRDGALRPSTLVGTGDSLFEGSASALYRHKHSDKIVLDLDYDVELTVHSDWEEYNLTSQIFTLNPTHKFTPLAQFKLQYSYIYSIVDGGNFRGAHLISPSFNHMHKKFGLTRVYYTFRIVDNWRNDTRDNDQSKPGVTHYYFLPKKLGRPGRRGNCIDRLCSNQSALDSRSSPGTDIAASKMIERVESIHPAILPDNWDGSAVLTSK